MRPKIGEQTKIELNGQWKPVKCTELDGKLPMLSQFCFIDDNRYEYIYLGSPRIAQIWRRLVKEKLVDTVIDFKFQIKEDLKDIDDCIIINPLPTPRRKFRPTKVRENRHPFASIRTPIDCPDHQCHAGCLQEDRVLIEKYSLFHRPLAVGFKRIQGKADGQIWQWKKPYYLSPCNIKLTSINTIRNYLITTGSKLRIDSFSLDHNFEASENVQLPYSYVVSVAVSRPSKYIV